MWKSIVRFLTSLNLGYMLLPQSLIKGDKQQHGLLAIWLAIPFLFLLNGIVGIDNNYFYALWYVVGTTVIGYAIEFWQKYRKRGVFDHNDVMAMILVSIVISLLYIFLI